MSRRDTIIIAVLVNAGLLIVLFATAMRSDKKSTSLEAPLAASYSTLENPISSMSAHEEGDQIETLLDHYTALPTSPSSSEEILFSHDAPSAFLAEDVPAPASQPLAAHSSSESSQAAIALQSPSPSSTSTSRTVSVTVKKGDVLEKIAKANGSTVSGIMKANNLASSQLKIGQVLKVPVKDGVTLPKSPGPSLEGGDYYTVKEGDSPWLIASKNNVKLDELLKLNNLDEQKAKRLRPGDRLKIR